MTRTMPGIALAWAAALALAVGTAAATPATLVGTVGPGHTIDLRVGGKRVTTLKAGVPYRLVVTDRSADHDFRLTGPGTSRVITGEEFVGKASVVLRLKKGAYKFLCAPHADEMRGGFRVTG